MNRSKCAYVVVWVKNARVKSSCRNFKYPTRGVHFSFFLWNNRFVCLSTFQLTALLSKNFHLRLHCYTIRVRRCGETLHSYVWHGFFICVWYVWPIHTRDVTELYVWVDEGCYPPFYTVCVCCGWLMCWETCGNPLIYICDTNIHRSHVYVCKYIYIYTNMLIVYIYIHVYIYTYIYIHIYTFTYMFTPIYSYLFFICMKYICIYIYTHIHIYIRRQEQADNDSTARCCSTQSTSAPTFEGTAP